MIKTLITYFLSFSLITYPIAYAEEPEVVEDVDESSFVTDDKVAEGPENDNSNPSSHNLMSAYRQAINEARRITTKDAGGGNFFGTIVDDCRSRWPDWNTISQNANLSSGTGQSAWDAIKQESVERAKNARDKKGKIAALVLPIGYLALHRECGAVVGIVSYDKSSINNNGQPIQGGMGSCRNAGQITQDFNACRGVLNTIDAANASKTVQQTGQQIGSAKKAGEEQVKMAESGGNDQAQATQSTGDLARHGGSQAKQRAGLNAGAVAAVSAAASRLPNRSDILSAASSVISNAGNFGEDQLAQVLSEVVSALGGGSSEEGGENETSFLNKNELNQIVSSIMNIVISNAHAQGGGISSILNGAGEEGREVASLFEEVNSNELEMSQMVGVVLDNNLEKVLMNERSTRALAKSVNAQNTAEGLADLLNGLQLDKIADGYDELAEKLREQTPEVTEVPTDTNQNVAPPNTLPFCMANPTDPKCALKGGIANSNGPQFFGGGNTFSVGSTGKNTTIDNSIERANLEGEKQASDLEELPSDLIPDLGIGTDFATSKVDKSDPIDGAAVNNSPQTVDAAGGGSGGGGGAGGASAPPGGGNGGGGAPSNDGSGYNTGPLSVGGYGKNKGGFYNSGSGLNKNRNKKRGGNPFKSLLAKKKKRQSQKVQMFNRTVASLLGGPQGLFERISRRYQLVSGSNRLLKDNSNKKSEK